MFTFWAVATLQYYRLRRSSDKGLTGEPSPGEGLFPTPGVSAPAREALTAPSEPSTRRCATAESHDGAVGAAGIGSRVPAQRAQEP